MSVTAIIVSYNSASVIRPCLANLQENGIAEVIVVDNASEDETCEIIKRDFPGVQLIENSKNEGFGRANNQALAQVKMPYALLINPDATLEQGALDALLAAAQKYKKTAIFAPTLLDEEGKQHKSFKRNVFNREKCSDEYIEPEGDICAEFLSGAVWLVDMKLMRTVGFFDKQIFLYHEDDDLCMRARKAGFGLVLVADAKATHAMGGSSGTLNKKAEAFRQYHLAYSRLYIEQKYHGKEAAMKMARKQHFNYALKASLYLLIANTKKVAKCRARIRGVFDFMDGKTTVP